MKKLAQYLSGCDSQRLSFRPKFAFNKKVLPLILFMSGVLTTFSAWAAATTPQQAENVVKGWLRVNPRHLGCPLGKVKSVKTFKETDGSALYHVVELLPHGFVIVPAEDWCEPIVGFSAGGTYDSSLKNPMGALVSRDLANRVKSARAAQKPNQAGGGAAQTASQKWATLEESGGTQKSTVIDRSLANPSTVLVQPLISSAWGQETVYDTNIACYNYYTPPYAAGNCSNYPCGCVATAMAQLMCFYQ
jgi:hypothetical protein